MSAPVAFEEDVRESGPIGIDFRLDLDGYEGPIDVLLQLAREQKVDLTRISILALAEQYLTFVRGAKHLRLELAADYLLMAAMLAEIKSRMLLPRPVDEEFEEDPRAELIRRLQEYERYKQAAQDLDGLPRLERDVFPVNADVPDKRVVRLQPKVSLDQLLDAFNDVLTLAQMFAHHHVHREALSVRERMSAVLVQIRSDQFTDFTMLFAVEEGRAGVVVTFLAILELLKDSLIDMVQSEPFGPIYVKAAA